MSTVSSVGAGKTYTTWALFEAAFATGGWIGEQTGSLTDGCAFTGNATSATDFIECRAASGQSWRDNASVQTNAYAFNASNGASITKNIAYGGAIFSIAEDYVTIKNLQLAQTHGSGAAIISNNSGSSSNCVLDSLIMEQSSTGDYGAQMRQGLVRNCLLILRHSSAHDAWNCGYGSAIYVNTATVRPSNFTAGATAFTSANGNTIKNCSVFGFTNFNTGTPTGSNNCSDTTVGFGTSNQASKTYANQFVTTTDTGRDFKPKTGADLLDHGVTDTTNIPAAIDAPGTSRPQGSAWDIGPWELVSSSSNPSFSFTGTGALSALSASFLGISGSGVMAPRSAVVASLSGAGLLNPIVAVVFNATGVGSLTATAQPSGISFAFTGSGVLNPISAARSSLVGVGALNPLAAPKVSLSGSGALAALAAAQIAMAGAGAIQALAAGRVSLAGTCSTTFNSLGYPSFAINGSGALTPVAAIRVYLQGVAVTNFIPVLPLWQPVGSSPALWTVQLPGETAWVKQ